MRLDQFLVFKNLVTSRSQAKDLIKAECVSVVLNDKSKMINSPSFEVEDLEGCVVAINEEYIRYVSRAGLKLEGALKQINKQVSGLSVLDVGISTGGFTDCLLQAGAENIVGVDVGHDQLHKSLQGDHRLSFFDGVNARALSQNENLQKFKGQFDLIVVDVSFISIKYILPELAFFLKPEGELLALIKPQFEVGKSGLNKKGVVKDPLAYAQIQTQIENEAKAQGFVFKDYFESQIKGKTGNREFFIYAKK